MGASETSGRSLTEAAPRLGLSSMERREGEPVEQEPQQPAQPGGLSVERTRMRMEGEVSEGESDVRREARDVRRSAGIRRELGRPAE